MTACARQMTNKIQQMGMSSPFCMGIGQTAYTKNGRGLRCCHVELLVNCPRIVALEHLVFGTLVWIRWKFVLETLARLWKNGV